MTHELCPLEGLFHMGIGLCGRKVREVDTGRTGWVDAIFEATNGAGLYATIYEKRRPRAAAGKLFRVKLAYLELIEDEQ